MTETWATHLKSPLFVAIGLKMLNKINAKQNSLKL